MNAGRTAATLLMLVGLSPPALARSLTLVPYPAADVWPATIRFLRVDRDYAIKEKDEAAGYVLFDATENKRLYRAALELVKTTDGEGRPATQLIVNVPELARHFELSLLDKLAAKLRDERGAPPPPPARRPASPPAAEGGTTSGGTTASPRTSASPGDLPRVPTWGPGAAGGDSARSR